MANKLRELVNKLAFNGPSKEEITQEALTTPIQASLPTHWQDAAGKTHLQANNTVVKAANQREVQQFGFAPRVVCGTCKYFDVSTSARVELARQQFAERLVNDERWKLQYLGVPLDHVGLCGASNGERATTSISAAGECDLYKPIRFKGG